MSAIKFFGKFFGLTLATALTAISPLFLIEFYCAEEYQEEASGIWALTIFSIIFLLSKNPKFFNKVIGDLETELEDPDAASDNEPICPAG